MKNVIHFISLLFSVGLTAQSALYNSGNIRIHDTGKLGIHTNLINNSTFDLNLGLVGFYGDETATVSGAFTPVFYDMEIFKPTSLALETTVDVSNVLTFIDGNIFTPRNQPLINLNLFADAITSGESNSSKIDGYSAIEGKQNFFFPVGDSEMLRALILNSTTVNNAAKCAYFLENPNNPSSFNATFNTTIKDTDIDIVHTTEFWRIENNASSTISIAWNERSQIELLTDDVLKLGIAGWHKTEQRWKYLGNSNLVGDLNEGFIESESFVPNDYEVVTFAAVSEPSELIDLDNYLVTPNGDGVNDFLQIPELEQSPNNNVQIFDRNGLKVFEQDNYTDQFRGYVNTNNLVYKKKVSLPSGVYFYLAFLDDLKLEFQGFLYLSD